MARAMVLALWCVAAASATRYVDYSGVKMPLYGGGSDYDLSRDFSRAALADDYRGHSPDAPAALDYKYEEEADGLDNKSDKPSEDVRDSEAWHRPARRQRELVRHDIKDDLVTRDKYSTEGDAIPKYRSNHRFPKHRSRLKTKNSVRDNASHRLPRYGRDKIDEGVHVDSKEYFNNNVIDKNEFRDDKSKEFEDDIDNLVHMTTERLSRKKTRDRVIKSQDLDMEDDDIVPDRRMKSEDIQDSDYPTHSYSGRRRPSEQREKYRPGGDEDDIRDGSSRRSSGRKQYEDYRDYYDMKRVNNIKNKFPLLLRRTTTRITTAMPTLDPDLYEVLWTHRRAASPPRTTTTGTTVMITTTSVTTSSATTVTTEPSTTSPIIATVSTASTTLNISKELSLAERSRLSILKKAMRKESVKSDLATKKPPVLLQVTNKLHTVVIVEPPVSQQPWMRAREVSGDSPERLEKVKKLMRHKLVAGSKSIQDLTNNWDDLICDYIDVSLIDHASSTHLTNRLLLFLNIIILVS